MQQLPIAAIKGLFWLEMRVEDVGVMDAGRDLHPFVNVSNILNDNLNKKTARNLDSVLHQLESVAL